MKTSFIVPMRQLKPHRYSFLGWEKTNNGPRRQLFTIVLDSRFSMLNNGCPIICTCIILWKFYFCKSPNNVNVLYIVLSLNKIFCCTLVVFDIDFHELFYLVISLSIKMFLRDIHLEWNEMKLKVYRLQHHNTIYTIVFTLKILPTLY